METTTMEKQVGNLSSEIKKYDETIEKMDSLIDAIERQKKAVVEQRAQLNSLRNTVTGRTTKWIATALEESAKLLEALEAAEIILDAQIAQTERILAEQREWFAQHHGVTH